MKDLAHTNSDVRVPGRPVSLVRRVFREVKQFLLISLYLWIILGLFALHKSIFLPQHGFLYGQGLAILNALVLGKVMFFAEGVHIGENFKTRPLVYPVLFKSVLFATILTCFYLVEEVASGALRGESISESVSGIAGGTLEGILAIGIIVFVTLIPLFAFREMSRLVGDRVMRELLFTRRFPLAPASEQNSKAERI
jgi:hypothetical protein